MTPNLTAAALRSVMDPADVIKADPSTGGRRHWDPERP
jgi:hypothetical protein